MESEICNSRMDHAFTHRVLGKYEAVGLYCSSQDDLIVIQRNIVSELEEQFYGKICLF